MLTFCMHNTAFTGFLLQIAQRLALWRTNISYSLVVSGPAVWRSTSSGTCPAHGVSAAHVLTHISRACCQAAAAAAAAYDNKSACILSSTASRQGCGELVRLGSYGSSSSCSSNSPYVPVGLRALSCPVSKPSTCLKSTCGYLALALHSKQEQHSRRMYKLGFSAVL